jgi:hypothetical protein
MAALPSTAKKMTNLGCIKHELRFCWSIVNFFALFLVVLSLIIYNFEAYAVADGKLPSDPIAYEFIVNPATGLSEMTGSKTVAGVRYFNAMGQEMQEANGLTIVVTTYTDGTTSTVKVMK